MTRLAFALADRLRIWTEEDYDAAKVMWTTLAEDLSGASYGSEMIHLIGKVYHLSALQFLGSADSGVGMPSIAKWAKGHYAQMEKSADTTKAKRDNLMAGMKMMTLQQKQAKELDEAKSDAEKQEKQAEMEAVMTEGMLNVMWTTTVVDITGTLHETIQLVLHDQSVDADTRKRRAYGLKNLGQIFMDCPAQSKTSGDAKKLYEEAAFAAMLETIKRKEEAVQAAHAH